MLPYLPMLRPGQVPTAAEWNTLVAYLSQTLGGTSGVTGGGIGLARRLGGTQVLDGRPEGHWARITSHGSAGYYAHNAVAPKDDGTWEDLPEDAEHPYGTTTSTPAVEVGANPLVPVDGTAIVWLWPNDTVPGWSFKYVAVAYRTDCVGGRNKRYVSYDGGTTWEFESYQGCCTCKVECCPGVTLPSTLCLDIEFIAGGGIFDCAVGYVGERIELVYDAGEEKWLADCAYVAGCGFSIGRFEFYCSEAGWRFAITTPTGGCFTFCPLSPIGPNEFSCTSPYRFVFSGALGAPCNWSGRFTITEGPCTGVGTDGGGTEPLCSISATDHGSGTDTGDDVVSVTLAGETVLADSTLLVALAVADNGGTVTVTFNGTEVAAAYSGSLSGLSVTGIWRIYAINVAADTTGDIVATYTRTGATGISINVAAVDGYCLSGTIDQKKHTGGGASAPNSGATGTTAVADEFVLAMAVLSDPGGGSVTDGTWGGGFTDLASVGPSSFRLRTGYQIASAVGTFTANLTGTTPPGWSVSVLTVE